MNRTPAVRAHPLMILRYLRRLLFVLLLPAARGLLRLGRGGTLSRLLLGEAALGALLVAAAVLKWSRCRIAVGPEGVRVRGGLIFRTDVFLPTRRISSVRLRRGPLLALTGAVQVRVDTEAGSRRRAEIDLLVSRRTADAIRLAGAVTASYRAGTPELILLAVASSSAAAGLLLAAPVVRHAGELLGDDLSRRLMGTLTQTALLLRRVLPPAATALALALAAGFAVSFLLTLFSCAPFRLRRRRDGFELESGAVVRRRTLLRADAVSAAVIRRPLLMLPLGRCTVEVSAAGYGKRRGERAVFLPAVPARELPALLRALLPPCGTRRLSLVPPRRALRRVLLLPLLTLAALPLGMLALGRAAPYLGALFALLGAAAEGIAACWLGVRVSCFRHGGADFSGGAVQISGVRRLCLTELCAAPDRTGLIRVSQSPFDRRAGLCTVRAALYTERAESLSAAQLDAEEVLRALRREYGV